MDSNESYYEFAGALAAGGATLLAKERYAHPFLENVGDEAWHTSMTLGQHKNLDRMATRAMTAFSPTDLNNLFPELEIQGRQEHGDLFRLTTPKTYKDAASMTLQEVDLRHQKEVASPFYDGGKYTTWNDNLFFTKNAKALFRMSSGLEPFEQSKLAQIWPEKIVPSAVKMMYTGPNIDLAHAIETLKIPVASLPERIVGSLAPFEHISPLRYGLPIIAGTGVTLLGIEISKKIFANK